MGQEHNDSETPLHFVVHKVNSLKQTRLSWQL